MLFLITILMYRDMGVIHPDNTLEVKGRKSDCLRFKINQKIVYPSYVEQAIEKFPGVSECAVSSVCVSYSSPQNGISPLTGLPKQAKESQ